MNVVSWPAARIAVALILIACANVACSKDLSRKDAEKLILATKTYPEPVKSYTKVPVGTFWACRPSRMANDPAVKQAVEDGLLVFSVTGNTRRDSLCYNDGYQKKELSAELTPAGKALVAAESPRRLDDNPDIVYFRACEIVFGGITGISFNEDRSQAQVEYRERYTRPTTWADNTANGTCTEGMTRTERVHFQKYDNGWRLQRY